MNKIKLSTIIASSLALNFLTGIYAASETFEDALKQKQAQTSHSAAKTQTLTAQQQFELEEEANLHRMKREVPKNIEHIQKGLQDGSLYPKEMEDMSIYDLGYAKDSRAIPVLVQVLKGYPVVRARADAADSLGRIGDKTAIPDLKSALADKDYQVRIAAAAALIILGEYEAPLPILTEIALGKNAESWELDSARNGSRPRQSIIDNELRYKAITTLSKIKNDDKVFGILITCLNDKNGHLQIAAGEGLAGTKYDSVVIPIIKAIIFKNKYYDDPSEAIPVLAKTKDPSAMAIIERLTTDRDPQIAYAAKRFIDWNKKK